MSLPCRNSAAMHRPDLAGTLTLSSITLLGTAGEGLQQRQGASRRLRCTGHIRRTCPQLQQQLVTHRHSKLCMGRLLPTEVCGLVM